MESQKTSRPIGPKARCWGTYWRFSIKGFLQFSVLSLIKAPAERTHFVFLLYFVLIFRYYISVCFVSLHWRFSVRGVLTVQCFEPHRGPSGTPPAFSEMRSCLMGGRVRSWAQPIGMQMVKIVLFYLYWCPFYFVFNCIDFVLRRVFRSG